VSPVGAAPLETSGGSSVLWYGGDYSGGQRTNNTMLSVQSGNSVLDDFVVDSPAGWHVTGLFSNNFKSDPPTPGSHIQAAWSIRPGIGPGVFEQIIDQGIGDATVVPTGRADEYRITVSGLSIDLDPGIYVLNVSPIVPPPAPGDFYVGKSGGANAVGRAGPGPALYERHDLTNGQPIHTQIAESFDRASIGVIGVRVVPEPSTWTVFALVLVALVVRRRRSGSDDLAAIG
jgi:hypothetical protein